MTRTWLVVAALLAALLAALCGVLAPTTAYAEGSTAGPSVTVTPGDGDEMSVFKVTVDGFAADKALTVAVSVIPDGGNTSQPYTGNYTRTRPAGTIAWNWIWTTGDPYGSYTMSVSDGTSSAGASFVIRHTATAPTPASGTQLMLDTASAPPLATMQAWQSGGAPYDAVAVYVPVDPTVDDRHDTAQANLTPDWVQAVQTGGWHVVPVYVGLQAPAACQRGSFHAMSADPAAAQTQGVAAADDAVASATKLGVDPGVPLVYDLERYEDGCSAAVQSFLLGWTVRLHQLHRVAAVYGNASTTAQDLDAAATQDPTYVLPDVFWAATENRRPETTSIKDLPPTPRWSLANQFLLGVERTYGGLSLTVDESAVDDAVWSIPTPDTTSPTTPEPTPPADTTGPIVTMGGAPALVTKAKATFTWSGVDAASGLASYELRTRRTAGGHAAAAWTQPTTAPAAVAGGATVKAKPGEQVCVQVRAVDVAGNRSDWTLPACTSRLADDRAAKPATSPKGWRRAHNKSAYRHTLTTTTRRHAVLRLGHSAGGSLAVAHSGGALLVRVGPKRVGTLTGSGTTWLALPRGGKVTLTAISSRSVAVDGFALAPR